MIKRKTTGRVPTVVRCETQEEFDTILKEVHGVEGKVYSTLWNVDESDTCVDIDTLKVMALEVAFEKGYVILDFVTFAWGDINVEEYNEDLDDIITSMSEQVSHDMVNHPNHYTQGGIECIDAMISAFGKEAVKSYCVVNAFKYIWRAEHKNGMEDLEKARWYVNKALELGEEDD